MIHLGQYLADHTVDVMKIDIEGAEVLALKGATNTLKHLRKIIVEIHGDNFENVNKILERSNFDLEVSKEAYHRLEVRLWVEGHQFHEPHIGLRSISFSEIRKKDLNCM